MSKYSAILLTVYGQAMITESATQKKPLIFTRVELGDGALEENESFMEFTKLKNSCLSMNINSITREANATCTIIAAVDNSKVEQGFFARELGVFAKVGDDGDEALFAYTNAGNYADYTPDKTSTLDEKQIAINLAVGNATSVTAVIGSAQYATLKNLQDHDADPDAHAEATDKHNKDANAHDGILQKIATLGEDILKKLALTTTITAITALQTGSWFGQLLKMVLTASGVKYNIEQNGYICLGSFFGGLIIQWGFLTAKANTASTWFNWPIIYPHRCLSVSTNHANDKNAFVGFSINVSASGVEVYPASTAGSPGLYVFSIGY